jgi:hypothetical protein
MTAGTDSFMGKAMPILGNVTLTSETAATDILTITPASSQTGNAVALSVNTSTANAIKISWTSTGAIAATAGANANAILVSPSSKSVMNCVVMYDGIASAGAPVNTCVAFLGVNGSVYTNGPGYLLAVAGSLGTMGTGVHFTNNPVVVGLTMTADPTSDSVYAGIKCLFGSKAYYILAVPDSSLS